MFSQHPAFSSACSLGPSGLGHSLLPPSTLARGSPSHGSVTTKARRPRDGTRNQRLRLERALSVRSPVPSSGDTLPPGASQTSGQPLPESRQNDPSWAEHTRKRREGRRERWASAVSGETAPSEAGFYLPRPRRPRREASGWRRQRVQIGVLRARASPLGSCPPAAPPCPAGAPRLPPGSAWVRAGAARPRVAAWGGRQGGAGRGGGGAAKPGSPPARRCPGLGRPRCPSRGASPAGDGLRCPRPGHAPSRAAAEPAMRPPVPAACEGRRSRPAPAAAASELPGPTARRSPGASRSPGPGRRPLRPPPSLPRSAGGSGSRPAPARGGMPGSGGAVTLSPPLHPGKQAR